MSGQTALFNRYGNKKRLQISFSFKPSEDVKIKDDFTTKYVLAYREVGRSEAQFLMRS